MTFLRIVIPLFLFLSEHDLRANASRLSRGKTGTDFSGSCFRRDAGAQREYRPNQSRRIFKFRSLSKTEFNGFGGSRTHNENWSGPLRHIPPYLRPRLPPTSGRFF